MRAVDGAKELLGDNPFIDAVSEKPRLAEQFCREHVVKKYTIVYRVTDDEVFFLRFFHQSQLYERFVMEWEQ